MTPEQAKRAAQTLEDVFTPGGDAGVIDSLKPRTAGGMAKVEGRNVNDWFRISDLTAAEDLVGSREWAGRIVAILADAFNRTEMADWALKVRAVLVESSRVVAEPHDNESARIALLAALDRYESRLAKA